jgi:hypothetical protein
MNFNDFLQKLNEASSTGGMSKTGEAVRKERLKGNATDAKSRDAARKRVERAREVPRERKSKQELIKEVLLVRTKSGKIQLIFKDSYNKNEHEILNKTEMTLEEARNAIKDPKFEQTRASQLLFGNVKEKEKSEKGEGKKEEDKKGERKKSITSKETEEKEEQPKAKRLSKEQIFDAMSQMTGEQLAQMPPEMRQEYFKMTRKPPANSEFDNLSYEALSVKFNLNPISSLPYNQQVLNALMFLAKIKAGAGEQEMQTYGSLAPAALEFTRSAFFTARKILSQIGDECIQNLVSSVEMGNKAVNAEGAVDMQCGNYRFKVSAGGELSLSTTQFDQSNKSFKGLIASALMQALSNPDTISKDPKLAEVYKQGQEVASKFSTTLIPDDALASIMQDPEMVKQLQSMKFKDSQGNDIGPAIDEEGNLNPLLSLNNYMAGWQESGRSLLKGAKSAQKSPFKSALTATLLKASLRGDNIIPPEMAPNHLVTVNGVFALSDEYFDAVSQNADVEMKPSKNVINSSNISNYKASAAEMLKKFRTLVEEKKSEKKMSLKDILVGIDTINPMELMVSDLVGNNDFSINASLLPGFSPKDINAVEYNYLKIGKKTIKIPVQNDEKVANQFLEESPIILNDLIIESLSNNIVLEAMLYTGLIDETEANFICSKNSFIAEDTSDQSIIQKIYYNAWNRLFESPDKIFYLLHILYEEYKRDYKKEYKNYHGKPKQRKERAARTAARELMIKKGRVKKGDGKDIDHKNPLRRGGSKGINNLRVRDKSDNRSDNGHKKGEKQNKGSWK